MVKKLSKDQNPERKNRRDFGVIIDCYEISISVFPPPREHGKPHCHVTSKKSCKIRSRKSDVYPEVKVSLDGSDVIVMTPGFSKKDLNIIRDIIFNDPEDGEISNDEYLETVWEALHGESKKS